MEIALLLIGIVLLVVGYRRNLRNMLLAAAILLFLAGALSDVVQGFVDGFTENLSSQSSLQFLQNNGAEG